MRRSENTSRVSESQGRRPRRPGGRRPGGSLNRRNAAAGSTHTQNVATSNGSDALHAQLLKLRDFVFAQAYPVSPVVIFGDLNIPSVDAAHYSRMLSGLAGFRDCWTIAGNPVDSGTAFAFLFIAALSFAPDDGTKMVDKTVRVMRSRVVAAPAVALRSGTESGVDVPMFIAAARVFDGNDLRNNTGEIIAVGSPSELRGLRLVSELRPPPAVAST